MVLRSVENGYQDAYHALGVCSVVLCESDLGRGTRDGAGEEGTGEVADGGYDYGEVVAALPEAVVGCLIAEDLGFLSGCGAGRGSRAGTYKHETNNNGKTRDLM